MLGSAAGADKARFIEDEFEQEEQYAEAIGMLDDDSKDNQKQAQRILKRLAVQGHARSQYVLGIVYLEGIGVIKNDKQANRWFKEAADQHYPPAMLSLAEARLEGKGGRVDHERARSLLEAIVDPESKYEMRVEEYAMLRRVKSRAFFFLGEIYTKGRGVDSEIERGLGFFEEASRMGDQDATMFLAIAYAEGTLVEKSVEKAKTYFELLDLQSSDALRRSLDFAKHPGIGQAEMEDLQKYGEEMRAAISRSILSMQTGFAKRILNSEGEEFDASFAAGLLEAAATGGHAEAQSELGALYWKGDGVEADREKAISLFTQAAEQDWVLAKYNLAVANGLTGAAPESGSASAALLESAAAAGLLAAQMKLDGEVDLGVLDSGSAKAYCLEKAEEQDARALYSLAMRKMKGWMVEREPDKQKIARLIKQSAESGYSRSQYMMGVMHMSGEIVVRNAQTAFWWLKSAAAQDHPKALYHVGVCYAQGIAVEVDLEKAYYCFQKSAGLGLDAAKNSLAAFYNSGIHVVKDEWRASELYLEAADDGDPAAAFNVGNCYLEGKGVKRDVDTGLEWISKSADKGNLAACRSLSRIYDEGLLVERDSVEAAYWTEKAAELGFRPSMKKTAMYYYHGDGIPRNRGKALFWISEYINRDGPMDPESLVMKGEYEDHAAIQAFLPHDYSAMIVYADLTSDPSWSGHDPEEAYRVLDTLAKRGFSGARFRLASLHRNGGFAKASEKKAHQLYRSLYMENRGSDLEVRKSIAGRAGYWISRCYRDGIGVRSNEAKSMDWLTVSADMGHGQAQYELGEWLVGDESELADFDTGVQWLMRAANNGNAQSHVLLAELNLKEPIPILDEETIISWLKDLVDSGSGEARTLLQRYGVEYRKSPRQPRPSSPKEDQKANPYAPIEAA